ncbi:MAG TPA: DNA-directed DNA polymerase II small subunit [Candidatus Nanoarchaeia archaeon]|nr:DNA-directed DNA polymerase II small subunit [Candidatus Nanoarchaeia archaeon]
MINKKNEEIVSKFFEKGILLNEEILQKNLDLGLLDKIETEEDLLVLNQDYAEVITRQSNLVDWYDVDRYRVRAEKDRDDDLYQSQLQDFKSSTITLKEKKSEIKQVIASIETALVDNASEFTVEGCGSREDDASLGLTNDNLPLQSPRKVTIVLSYQNLPKKYVVRDFSKIFVSRYKFLEKILQNHQELKNPLTITRLILKQDKEQVSIIGIISDIAETKNGNIIVTLEDTTGDVKVLISKNKSELYHQGKDLVLDEVIGVTGVCGDKIIFAERIIWPDIPQNHDLKRSLEEEYAVFLSDIHVGSTFFLKKEFERFLKWIGGDFGNDVQKTIAKKVKYIFIAGDLVDGVGIYPSQETELEIKDIKGQYGEFARLIKKIPNNISIIICPGNHDVVHLAEPQPAFYQEFSPGLFELSNVKLVTNPSVINIGKTETFEGFDVLMYHGYSFDYYVANVESIRASGGYHRSDLIMKFLLKRRHLAPSFRSTPYFPAYPEDPLLIKTIPDFFLTGHIHYSCVANYRGITMISGSCWQAKTDFQEKLGHEPEPARVPVVNLRTREIKVLRFG